MRKNCIHLSTWSHPSTVRSAQHYLHPNLPNCLPAFINSKRPSTPTTLSTTGLTTPSQTVPSLQLLPRAHHTSLDLNIIPQTEKPIFKMVASKTALRWSISRLTWLFGGMPWGRVPRWSWGMVMGIWCSGVCGRGNRVCITKLA